jgi:hypothetical protein
VCVWREVERERGGRLRESGAGRERWDGEYLIIHFRKMNGRFIFLFIYHSVLLYIYIYS